MTMSHSTTSKSSSMIRRSPSTPLSTCVTLQALDSRKLFSVVANCSSSSSSRTLSVLPSREIQVFGGINLSESSVRLRGLRRNRPVLFRRNCWERSLRSVADYSRRDEDHQFLLLIGAECSSEKFSQPRYVAEKWNFLLAVDLLSLDQAAQHDGCAVT